MNRESIKRDIAIIGTSCKFSKSENPAQFWENLKLGNELIEFYTDDELIKLGINKSIINNPRYVKIKNFIDNSDSFDYPFFNYTKDEANLMDPQIRILHQLVWSSMEDAGYNPLSYNDKIGMYMTASDNFNWIAHSLMSENESISPFFLSQISNKNFISSLISYNLNLKGPSVTIDTACSSSLTTVHLACRSLLLKECSIALAGGIKLNTNKNVGYEYQENMIFSKDGYCRTFDSESTGTTESQGGAVVVLKKLEEAINDRDNIYAVIRSTSINNDGKRKIGYTAPSVVGQSDCIKTAHKTANVPYNTISYIEAHGTGTKLGDPVEIEALNKSFNYDTSHKCAIGSIKSNAGHLGNAAGIIGLLKTTLSIKNKMIPASLHFKNPNPEINFDNGPFYVNTILKKWEQINNSPLRAGVSSFGIGGTNVHVILEEYEKIEKQSNQRPFQLIAYSAKTKSSLNNYTEKLKDFINAETFDLADLAYTLKTGRADFSYKNFIVCQDIKELLFKLNENIHDQIIIEKENRNLIFMFPGQGSQYFEMGKDLYYHEQDFKIIMDQGFKMLFDLTGDDYSKIIGYKSNENIDKNLVNETQFTQPLLFLIEYALASLLLKWGIKPNYMIGHSLGEYVAACIAEVFSLKDALTLIVKRSQLMSEVEKGSMISIDASIDQVQELINGKLSIAAINSQTSSVVSGSQNDISDIVKVLNLNEISFSQLKTSHAFHSGMMDIVLDRYEQEFNKIKLSIPKLPFISNLTGKQILDNEAISPKYWARHLRETVNFKDGVDFLLQKSNSVFVEIGPGKTLLTFSKQNKRYSKKDATIELVRHFNESINDNQKFTEAIGEIWNQGIKINWNEYYSFEERSRISVPTYCFDNYKLDFIVDPFQNLKNNEYLNNTKPLNEWFYMPNWKRSLLKKKSIEVKKNQQYLIFSAKNSLITFLADKLRENGNNVIEVTKKADFGCIDNQTFEMNPNNENDFLLLFKHIESNNIQIDQIIFNWNFEGEDQELILSTFLVFNNFCKSLINYLNDLEIKITLLCNFNHTIIGNEKVNISMNTAMRQFYVFSQENPNIFTCSIDVNQDINDNEIVFKIIDDLQYNYSDTTIAFRGKNRWIEFYDSLDFNSNNKNEYLKENKTYLITGGLGKVGKILTTYLCDIYKSKVIIIGRRIIPSENLSESSSNEQKIDSRLMEAFKDLEKLKEGNRPIFYYNTDVSDYNAFNEVIEKIESEHGKISGVIHAAGNINNLTFKPIEKLDAKIALKQFQPKVQGTINLNIIFKNRNLDFVWITSSLSSVLGGLTFGAYSVANAFIDSFVNNKREDLKNWFCINLDGIVEGKIDNQKLIELFEKTFSLGNHQIIVSVKDPNLFNPEQKAQKVEQVNNDSIIDRNVLSVNYVAPTTIIEEKLCDIVQSFLGYNKIGVLDNFFEIGGDSLKAMTLIKRVNKSFEIELNIQDFYSTPNIKEFSEQIELSIKLIKLQEKSSGKNTIII